MSVNSKTRVALFPGSFDPLTHGHREVVNAALDVFDKVVIGIGISASKKFLFSVDERLAMTKAVFVGNERVDVASFQGLAVDYAKQINAVALIRGLRTESDFAYEMPMALINKKLNRDLQTVFFPTASDLAYVSSSVVKEIAQYGGDIHQFVPDPVWKALRNKLVPQHNNG